MGRRLFRGSVALQDKQAAPRLTWRTPIQARSQSSAARSRHVLSAQGAAMLRWQGLREGCRRMRVQVYFWDGKMGQLTSLLDTTVRRRALKMRWISAISASALASPRRRKATSSRFCEPFDVEG